MLFPISRALNAIFDASLATRSSQVALRDGRMVSGTVFRGGRAHRHRADVTNLDPSLTAEVTILARTPGIGHDQIRIFSVYGSRRKGTSAGRLGLVFLFAEDGLSCWMIVGRSERGSAFEVRLVQADGRKPGMRQMR